MSNEENHVWSEHTFLGRNNAMQAIETVRRTHSIGYKCLTKEMRLPGVHFTTSNSSQSQTPPKTRLTRP